MSDPTSNLLTTYARALARKKVPETERQLALLFAKNFLDRVVDEKGRLGLNELKSATLEALSQQLSEHGELLMQILIDPEQRFGALNSEMHPEFLK